MAYNLGRLDPEERTDLYADPRDEEPPARPRRVLKTGAALLVMGLFAAGLWLAYVAGVRHSHAAGDIPLIRADTRPIKVRPTDPGGMPIPDRDMLIYGASRPAVEHLLPPPETPMARPAPPPPPPAAASPSSAAAPAAAGSPSAAAAGAGAAASLPASAADGASAAAARPPIMPAQPEQPVAVSLASARPAMPKTAPAGAAAPRTGGVRLQLGAVRSEQVAREEWGRIRRDNADLLGHLSAATVRADLGGKGVYYRIQTAPLGDASTADRVCGELRQRHLGCIIVR